METGLVRERCSNIMIEKVSSEVHHKANPSFLSCYLPVGLQFRKIICQLTADSVGAVVIHAEFIKLMAISSSAVYLQPRRRFSSMYSFSWSENGPM